MTGTSADGFGSAAVFSPQTWLGLRVRPLDLNGPAGFAYPAAETDWTGQLILELFRHVVETAPDQAAIDDGSRRLSRRQVWNGACRLAAELAAKTPTGGAVGVLLPNDAGYAVAVLGCLAAGRPCVLLDRHYPAARNRTIIDGAGLAAIVIEAADLGDPAVYPTGLAAFIDAAAAASGELMPAPAGGAALDDPALIVYTSGSTGAPKGIALSQRAVLHRARELIDSLHMAPADVSLPLASPCTVAGIQQLLEALLSGALLLKLDLQRVGLGAVLDTIAEKRVSLLFATPALLRTMARLDGVRDRLGSLRCVHPSGEVLLSADLDLLRDCLPTECAVLLVYGLTEAPAICQWFVPRGHAAAGARVAVGYRLPGYDCAILGQDDSPVGLGETGELVVRSRFTALGEWRDGRLTAGPFAPDPDDPALSILRTGDLAWVRGDGALVIAGRKDRQVQIHGMRVEPYEIENVLRRAAGVLDAAVIARDDADVPSLVAFVVLAQEQRANGTNELWAHLQENLPAYMHPARITAIDGLPLLPGHKLDADALVALDITLAGRGVSGDESGKPASAQPREYVAQAWTQLLGSTALDADAPFCEGGGDSLALLQLVLELEKLCGTRLPFASFSVTMCPSELAQVVESALATQRGRVWGAQPAAGATPLVLLRDGRRRPAIFIAHGLGGHVGEMVELARLLRTDHPIYALQARGLGGEAPSDRIEDIAQYFCGALEAAEPDGPYLLIGYSLGGLVMVELARLLRQHGREVRLLVLLDTYPHPRFWPLRPWLSFLADRILRQGVGAARLPPGQMVRRFARLIGAFIEHVVFRIGIDRQPRDPAGGQARPALRRMRESLSGAEARYRPRAYPGEIAFFRAEAAADGTAQDPRLVWAGLADGLEVIMVPGEHLSIFTETLAARLSERLARALGAPA